MRLRGEIEANKMPRRSRSVGHRGSCVSTEPVRVSFAAASDIETERRIALLGGKGAALVRMVELGLPVPPGFVLTTVACREALVGDGSRFEAELFAGLSELEATVGRRLADPASPLLVSVRSSGPVSMPGMMDTVLDIGATDAVLAAMGERAGDERFAPDVRNRFIRSYTAATSVPEVDVPADSATQLRSAARAVVASWMSDRAQTFRRVEDLGDEACTAVIVQAMVLGNLGPAAGTGVVFSRDPSTGAPGLVGDFLVGAQGDDVAGGTHATRPVREMRDLWPSMAEELEAAATVLERDLADLVEIEFTIEAGSLWLLQARRATRSAAAAMRIAVDMAEDPAFPLTRAEAVGRVRDLIDGSPRGPDGDPDDDPTDVEVLAFGLAASPGRAVGAVCTSVDDVLASARRGDAVVLFRRDTAPADVAGIAAAEGLVTTRGGIASHAAVVARGWGVPAVVGVASLEIDASGIRVDGRSLAVGEVVTVDGDGGRVLRGAHPAAVREAADARVLRAWRADVGGPTPPAASELASSAPLVVESATPEACERVLALKGVATAAAIAAALGCAIDDVEETVAGLLAAGEIDELAGGGLRLRPAGTAQVDRRYALAAVRLAPRISHLLVDFRGVNGRFARLVTQWQASGPSPDLVARLRDEIHAEIEPIIEAVAVDEARFARYRDRLSAALGAIDDGDVEMVADPLRDSYHTVWFELHEELIRLSGRTRADEAAAGRA